MSRSRPAPSMSLLVSGIVAGIVVVGCTRQAASSAAATGASDSAPTANTGAPLPVDTPPAPEPRKPVGHPVPKPREAPTPAPTPTPNAAPDKSLVYDPATNTVTFELIAGPFTFNGYRNGGASLTVPSKANMVINFVNKDGTPHSAVVISGDGPIPNAATDPAIPRAYTNKALEGLPQEAGDVMRFAVPESGTYRIFCGVPGHGLSGMWIWMKVEPGAKAPTFGPTKA